MLNLRLRRRVGQLVEVDQRERMHLDVVRDDELHARQAHPFVGDEGERKRLLGIGQVHHHLGARAGQGLQVGARHLKRQRAFIDEAGVAFGAAHRHHLAVLEQLGAGGGPDDGRHAQLAADDGGMAGAPPAVGDDGGSLLHDGLPVRIGLVRDEHFALLKLAQELRALDDPHPPGGNLRTDAAAAGEHGAALPQGIRFQDIQVLARLHGLRARLHNEQLARVPILGPFQIHRHRMPALGRVVILDNAGPARELQDLVIREREPGAFGGCHRDVLDHPAAAGVVHQFEFLAAHGLLQDGPVTGLERGLENDVFIGRHRALHHVLAQSVRGADDHGIAETGLRVDGEDDT